MASRSSTTDIGALLHAACRRRDLTVCDVARLCDITSEYMCDLVAGKRPPTVEAAERLIAVLHLRGEDATALMRFTGDRDITGVNFGVVHPSAID